MEIDMRGFKVIYKERVYNTLRASWEWGEPETDAIEKGMGTPKFLTVIILNEDGEVRLLHDETFMFQFTRITN